MYKTSFGCFLDDITVGSVTGLNTQRANVRFLVHGYPNTKCARKYMLIANNKPSWHLLAPNQKLKHQNNIKKIELFNQNMNFFLKALISTFMRYLLFLHFSTLSF